MGNKNFIYNEDLIKEKLLPFDSPQRLSIKDDFFAPAAVLFTIRDIPNKPFELVLIHRTEGGRNHAGQMSFPGGKFESTQDNSLMDTALRETEEEIGVPRKNVKILGCLHDFPTISGYNVSPFVGVISENQQMLKQESEVQAIVTVPIDFFVDKNNFREESFIMNGNKHPMFYYDYTDKKTTMTYSIWGATAHLILVFIDLVYELKISKFDLKKFRVDDLEDLKLYIKNRNLTSKSEK
jgi:8-oxo-dGTP pyrophosphatase MutT (NUDIX family)